MIEPDESKSPSEEETRLKVKTASGSAPRKSVDHQDSEFEILASGEIVRKESKMTSWDKLGSYFIGKELVQEITHSIVDVEQLGIAAARNAQVTYDYFMLVFLASMIAALGLGTNSSVTVIASMLVSPISGPIVSAAYAMQMLDFPRFRKNAMAEVISAGICVLLGFCFSFILIYLENEDMLTAHLPTGEMQARGVEYGLVPSAIVAFASGVAAGIGATSSNVAGLIGVAISGSLLPPLVNCGIYLGLEVDHFAVDKDFVLTEACQTEAMKIHLIDEAAYSEEGLYNLKLSHYNYPRIIHQLRYSEAEWVKKNTSEKQAALLALKTEIDAGSDDCKSKVMDFKMRALISFCLAVENIILIGLGVFCVFSRKISRERRKRRKRRRVSRAKNGLDSPRSYGWKAKIRDYLPGPMTFSDDEGDEEAGATKSTEMHEVVKANLDGMMARLHALENAVRKLKRRKGVVRN